MLFTCQNVNPSKLLSELKNANVTVNEIKSDLQFGQHIAKNASFEIKDTDLQVVQAVTDTHNPAPIPPQPTKEEILAQQVPTNMDYLLDVDFRLMLLEFGMV